MKKITLFLTAIFITTVAFAANMSGTYKVGSASGSDYALLSEAVVALNAATITGDVILEINSDITEPANIGLGVDTKGFSITIRPNADADRTITFTKLTDNVSPTGHLVIGYTDLTTGWSIPNTIATNNVTIDGFAVGGSTKRLKITNANTTHGARMVVVVGACVNTTIKNCIIVNATTNTGSPFALGAVVRKVGTVATDAELAPNGLVFENNTITCTTSTVGMGIRITNSNTPATAKVSGFVCKNNIISAQRRILEINYTNGGEISGNTISLIQPTSTALGYGIWTATGCAGVFNIYSNKFIASSCTGADAAAGGQRVMSLGGSVTCNVYNNMFAGMNRAGTAVGAVNQTYCFFGCTGKIYNNTFYMPALTVKTNTGYYSAIQLSFANPEIKNNIFISDEDGMINAFYSAVSTAAVDNNIFFNRAGTTKSLIVSGTTNSTLALHQAANPTKDISSKSVDVNFVDAAAGDLRLTGASIGDLNLEVDRLDLVTKDLFGAERGVKTYAGAHDASSLVSSNKVFTVTVPNGTERVYVVGSFTDKVWDIVNPYELTKTATANVFSGSFPCVDGIEYKYMCEKATNSEDWDYLEAVYNGVNNPNPRSANRTYNAADVVPIWYRVNKITFNAGFARDRGIPKTLFVMGSFNSWGDALAMTKSGETFSVVLGGNPGDKYPANTEYKYYTNDMGTVVLDHPKNLETEANGGVRENRWSTAPVMKDEIKQLESPLAATISGVYKVGTTTGAHYSSLSQAVAALYSASITGNIVFEITSDITEPANIGLGVDTKGFSITIRPDADADRTITFTKTTDNASPSGHFVIGYSDLTTGWSDANTIATNNVTIDGYAVGKSTRRLKFTNDNVSITGSKLTVIVGACENTTIKNCIYENKSKGGSPQCIGMVARKGVAIEVAPNGVIIDNNILTSMESSTSQGVNTTSSGTLTTVKTSGLVIKNNTITAQARVAWFYYINGADFYNNVLRLKQLGNANTVNYGLWTGTGTAGVFNIYNNKFIESSTMEATATGALGMRTLSLGSGAVYNIYNNMFSGLDRKVATAATVNQTYIFFGGTGHISNNTFYMPALTQPTTPGYYNAIQLSFANPDMRNNIFISNEGTVANAFYSAVSTGIVENNVYYNTAGNTKSLYVAGTTLNTIALYKAANPTKDVNSKSVNVNFIDAAAGDLKIAGASIGDLNLRVDRIAEVMKDMFGTNRGSKTYAGAHEASIFPLPRVFTVTVPVGTEKVFMAGSFPGRSWVIEEAFELKPTANANEFSGAFDCESNIEYRYLCDNLDWDYQEAIYDGGEDPTPRIENRKYNAIDNVPIWFRVNKITLNVSIAPQKAIPSALFVKGSFNYWEKGMAMIKTGNTFSYVLGGQPGDKLPANIKYKYYTNDKVLANWEVNAQGGDISDRWSIAPIMNDVIARFKTELVTGVNNMTVEARIIRTTSGIEVILDGEAKIELYNINGVLLDSKTVNSNYSHALDNGIYIISINGNATKFIK